jgi:hypothetical protein
VVVVVVVAVALAVVVVVAVVVVAVAVAAHFSTLVAISSRPCPGWPLPRPPARGLLVDLYSVLCCGERVGVRVWEKWVAVGCPLGPPPCLGHCTPMAPFAPVCVPFPSLSECGRAEGLLCCPHIEWPPRVFVAVHHCSLSAVAHHSLSCASGFVFPSNVAS